jgi:RimJ/RimL family protein N-acetyltransferase
MRAMANASVDDTLPSIALRRLDAARARAIVDRKPCDGDTWVTGYPADGDVEAAGLAIRTGSADETTPFACYEVVDDLGRIIGGAGFHGPPGPDGIVEIGYGIAPPMRNRGFAKAAIRELVAIATDGGAQKVTARTDPSNEPSRRALEQMGFSIDRLDNEFVHLSFECAPVRRRATSSR